MNRKNQFISGLLAGMVISASAFLFTAANLKENSGGSTPIINDVQQVSGDTSLSGNYISVQDADPMIQSYTSDFISKYKLPAGSSIGGIVGKTQLIQAASVDDGKNYVKFRFYLNSGQETGGDPQIGIMFYPASNSEQLIRTGSSSFCPTICDVPD